MELTQTMCDGTLVQWIQSKVRYFTSRYMVGTHFAMIRIRWITQWTGLLRSRYSGLIDFEYRPSYIWVEKSFFSFIVEWIKDEKKETNKQINKYEYTEQILLESTLPMYNATTSAVNISPHIRTGEPYIKFRTNFPILIVRTSCWPVRYNTNIYVVIYHTEIMEAIFSSWGLSGKLTEAQRTISVGF